MPNQAELRQQVGELAVRLVLAEGEGGPAVESWTQALEAIHTGALDEGAAEAAEVARAVLSAIRASGNPATVLQEGLARLESALEMPSQPAVKATSLAQDPELLSDFVLESREHLASLETELLVLERDPSNSEALHSIFRGFHTIKGLAGFLELLEVQKMAHEVETVLDQARNLKFRLSPEAIDVILESADYLKRWLAHLESGLNGRPSRAPESDPKLLERVAGIPLLSVTQPGVGTSADAADTSVCATSQLDTRSGEKSSQASRDPGNTITALALWRSK